MDRLDSESVVWLATTRPDGRPHLTPIWFVFHDDRFWICTERHAVKTRNVAAHPHVALSLESGMAPVVAEGTAVVHDRPYPAAVAAAFAAKFQWDIDRVDDPEGEYGALIEIRVDRWLMGGPGTAPATTA